MPQSLSQVIVHLVLSTKNRELLLDPAIRPRIHADLSTVCRDRGCEAYRVGGVADHVHLAVRLGRTISQSDLVERSSWFRAQIQADEIAFRVSNVEQPVGQGGRGPAEAAEDLGAGEGVETREGRIAEEELAFLGEDEQFAAGANQ